MPALALLVGLLLVTVAAGCHQRRLKQQTTAQLVKEQRARQARGDAAGAMTLAELIKCRRLRRRLQAAGARPLALPDRGAAELQPLAAGRAFLSLYQDRGRLQRYLALGRRVIPLRSLQLTALEQQLIQARDELEFGDLRGRGLLPQLARLHRALLADVWAAARRGAASSAIQRLLVSPDGLTRVFPLHALVMGRTAQGAPRFVAQQVSVSYTPCLALATRRPRRVTGVAVVTPTYGADPVHLSGARAEAEMIFRTQQRVTLHRGVRATAAVMQQALRADRAVVHYSGHGLAPLDPPAPPELVFPGAAPGVTVASASQQRVRAELVVLASCTTAYGARFRDAARRVTPVTLPEALLAAGARWVVAASWDTKDRFSADQMARLYTHLGEHGPAGAMTRAYRHSIARLRPPHPRFWAPYALYGGW